MIPEKERQALLRFADFESKRIEAADDTTLMMMHVALYLLIERDPKRMARIVAGAIAIHQGEVEGTQH